MVSLFHSTDKTQYANLMLSPHPDPYRKIKRVSSQAIQEAERSPPVHTKEEAITLD